MKGGGLKDVDEFGLEDLPRSLVVDQYFELLERRDPRGGFFREWSHYRDKVTPLR